MLTFRFSHAHHLHPILETTHLLSQSAPRQNLLFQALVLMISMQDRPFQM